MKAQPTNHPLNNLLSEKRSNDFLGSKKAHEKRTVILKLLASDTMVGRSKCLNVCSAKLRDSLPGNLE
jgi:hypothetical protein